MKYAIILLAFFSSAFSQITLTDDVSHHLDTIGTSIAFDTTIRTDVITCDSSSCQLRADTSIVSRTVYVTQWITKTTITFSLFSPYNDSFRIYLDTVAVDGNQHSAVIDSIRGDTILTPGNNKIISAFTHGDIYNKRIVLQAMDQKRRDTIFYPEKIKRAIQPDRTLFFSDTGTYDKLVWSNGYTVSIEEVDFSALDSFIIHFDAKIRNGLTLNLKPPTFGINGYTGERPILPSYYGFSIDTNNISLWRNSSETDFMMNAMNFPCPSIRIGEFHHYKFVIRRYGKSEISIDGRPLQIDSLPFPIDFSKAKIDVGHVVGEMAPYRIDMKNFQFSTNVSSAPLGLDRSRYNIRSRTYSSKPHIQGLFESNTLQPRLKFEIQTGSNQSILINGKNSNH